MRRSQSRLSDATHSPPNHQIATTQYIKGIPTKTQHYAYRKGGHRGTKQYGITSNRGVKAV